MPGNIRNHNRIRLEELYLTSSDHHDDSERDSVVETRVFNSHGHDQSSEEHVVGGVEIVDGNLA